MFLDGTSKVVGLFLAHILYGDIVDYQVEENGLPFMVPQSGCMFGRPVPVWDSFSTNLLYAILLSCARLYIPRLILQYTHPFTGISS